MPMVASEKAALRQAQGERGVGSREVSYHGLPFNRSSRAKSRDGLHVSTSLDTNGRDSVILSHDAHGKWQRPARRRRLPL